MVKQLVGHVLYGLEHALDAFLEALIQPDWQPPRDDEPRKTVAETCYCAGMGYREALVDGKYAYVDCSCQT